MSTIRPSDVHSGLVNQNSSISELLSGISSLVSSIDSYTGESELQGQAFTSHKAYMTEGHLTFLRKYSTALEALMEANDLHISAIGNLFEPYYNETQIQSEISSLNRQIRAIENSLLNRALDLVGADLLLFQNRRDDLSCRVRELELRLERLRSYLAATNGIYSSAESLFIEANRLLMVLETATRCPETGRVTMLPVDDAEIQFYVNSCLRQSALFADMSDDEFATLLTEMREAGLCLYTMFGGDPVNLSTGNFIYSKEDLQISGRYPLEFKRFYNSIGGTESVLGTGWTHNYNIRVHDKGNTAHVIFGDGRAESFDRTKDGGYVPPHNSDNLLSKKEEAWELKTKEYKTYQFGRDGLLRSISDPNGNATTFEYKDGLLTKVCNPCGSFVLKYKDGRIVRITDHTGRAVKFRYSDNHLSKVIHPDSAEYEYGYDRNGCLTKITNPLGIETIKNEYDENGRIIRQSFADGGVYALGYDDKLTTATEQNGNVIRYEHDEKHRTTGIIYSDSEERFEYNEQNKRTKHTDRNGNVRRYEYDESGNVTKAMDPLGHETAVEYNKFNKPTEITNPSGAVTKHEYDDNGNITAVINPLDFALKLQNDDKGQITRLILPDESTNTISYDDRGNISAVTDALGNETRYEYDELNRVINATDPMGNATCFEYNDNGDISKATNADGKHQTYEYNKSGKLTKLTDFGGNEAEFRYNAIGKLEEIVNPSGGITRLEYDLMWNVTKVTDPCGNSVHYEYDRNQRVIKTIDEEGNATEYEQDPNGNVTAVINPLGARTEISIDALDRQTEIAEPDGAVTKLEYDAMGNVAKVTDPQNVEIHREYDVAGRLISITDQMGNTTEYTYTALGQIETVTDALGGTTKHSYYPGGRLKSVTHPGGERESYTYDKNGNITEITDVLGSITKISYDSLNRITVVTNALGYSKQFRYDALGNITGIADENGNETSYKYSPTGELIEAIDALGHSKKYSYDKKGRMTRMEQYRTIDGTYADIKQIELQVTAWERNKRGEVTKKSTPLGGEAHYKYDPLGNLVSKLDEDSLETLYEYNLANRLAKLAYADGKTVELSYNALGQLTQLKDWLGTTAIELDAIGRATKVTDHENSEVGYAWDKLSRRESMTYPDKSKVEYSYDKSGRISSVTSETGITQYNYSISDRLLERIMPGNIVTQRRMDSLGRLESLTHRKEDDILDSFKYSYDPAGNITQIEKHRSGAETDSGVFSYVYDPLGRLTEATNGQGTKQYRYDNLGNRIMSAHNGIETRHSYNARNQLIQTTEGESVKNYNYDARGNLTQVLENGAISSTFTFNAANRMVGAVTPKGKAEYEYNGFIKRVSKLETLQSSAAEIPDPLNDIKYTLDMTKPYNDLIAIGDQRFIWGDELLHSEGSNVFTYLADHLGSPVRLMDSSRQETLGYDEFGVPAVEAGGNDAIPNMQNPFGFTGYQSDNISEIQYAQARYYIPALGRFGAEDTHWHTGNIVFGDDIIQMPSGILLPNLRTIIQQANSYEYCIGNPLTYVDKTGCVAVFFEDSEGEWRFLMDNKALNVTIGVLGYIPFADSAVWWVTGAISGNQTVSRGLVQDVVTNIGAVAGVVDIAGGAIVDIVGGASNAVRVAKVLSPIIATGNIVYEMTSNTSYVNQITHELFSLYYPSSCFDTTLTNFDAYAAIVRELIDQDIVTYQTRWGNVTDFSVNLDRYDSYFYNLGITPGEIAGVFNDTDVCQ